MKPNPNSSPQPPSIAARNAVRLRMQGWDFTSPAHYFLTICTKHMHPAFGTVVNGHMILNDAGRIADTYWRQIPDHFPKAILGAHVVMPNHVHGLIQLAPDGWDFKTRTQRLEAFSKPIAGSIPTIIRSYKSAVSKALGKSVWQSRFYEVRARDEPARKNIRRYILDNPANYDAVINAGTPKMLGNQALLEMPKVGFFASRGSSTPHGTLPVKPGEAIISGFLSPMERTIFHAALKHKHPIIWILPKALTTTIHGNTACPTIHGNTACRVAIENGQLLVLSPFPDSIQAPNARRAAWCNQYALAHCNRAIVGNLTPDGMLACILAEANPEIPIQYL